MAKIDLGGVVANISGSQNGITYARNRNGAYIRNKGLPVNPRTAPQLTVRSRFTNISQGWRSITPAQRNAWDALGASIVRSNSLGKSYSLTGLQAYQAVNLNRLAQALAIEDDAPALGSPPALTATLLVAVGASNSLTVTATSAGTSTTTIRVYATGVLSAGRKFIRRSEYRLIGNLIGTTTFPISIASGWNNVYGPLTAVAAGGLISVLLTPESAGNLLGSPSRVDAIVT